MSKTLVIDPKSCTGCRLCELVCSFKKTETYNPARSNSNHRHGRWDRLCPDDVLAV